MEARSLLKLYGIRFDILVTGQVGTGLGRGVCGGGGQTDMAGGGVGHCHRPRALAQPSVRQGSSGSSPRPSQWARELQGSAW